ncbi:hypothetical protein ACLB2K_037002 [Fragaria x ananassa]
MCSVWQEFGECAGVGGSMGSRWSDPDGVAQSTAVGTVVVWSLPCSRVLEMGGQRGSYTKGFMGMGFVICWVMGFRLMIKGHVPGPSFDLGLGFQLTLVLRFSTPHHLTVASGEGDYNISMLGWWMW